MILATSVVSVVVTLLLRRCEIRCWGLTWCLRTRYILIPKVSKVFIPQF